MHKALSFFVQIIPTPQKKERGDFIVIAALPMDTRWSDFESCNQPYKGLYIRLFLHIAYHERYSLLNAIELTQFCNHQGLR